MGTANPILGDVDGFGQHVVTHLKDLPIQALQFYAGTLPAVTCGPLSTLPVATQPPDSKRVYADLVEQGFAAAACSPPPILRWLSGCQPLRIRSMRSSPTAASAAPKRATELRVRVLDLQFDQITCAVFALPASRHPGGSMTQRGPIQPVLLQSRSTPASLAFRAPAQKVNWAN